MVNLFTPYGRISRREYIIGTVVVTVSGMVVAFVAGLALGNAGMNESAATGMTSVLAGIALVLQSFLAIRRLRDLGKPGWHLVLFLVPLYSIYLGLIVTFAPGKTTHQRWGPETSAA